MGWAVRDVVADVGGRLEPFSRVVAAYATFRPKTNTLHIKILLDDFDENTDQNIADVEAQIAGTYEDYAFDFSVIHLCGRDPAMFDPGGDPTHGAHPAAGVVVATCVVTTTSL